MTPRNAPRAAAGGPPLAGALVALGLGAAAGLAPAQEPGTGEAGRAEVRSELEAYYADFSARDWDAFADHFWEGAALTSIWRPPGEPDERVVAQTVPDFVAAAPEGPGSREIFEERMTDVRITVRGPLAQAWARYEARFGDPGEVAEWTGTDAFTLLRHGGRWRIASLAYAGDDGGAGEDQSEETATEETDMAEDTDRTTPRGLRTTIYHVSELEAAKEWYGRLFDAEPYFDEPFYAGFEIGGFELGLLPDEGPRGAGGTVAYWAVGDARAAYERALELGAGEHTPPKDVGEGIVTAVVTDPDGNLVGLIENPHFDFGKVR